MPVLLTVRQHGNEFARLEAVEPYYSRLLLGFSRNRTAANTGQDSPRCLQLLDVGLHGRF